MPYTNIVTLHHNSERVGFVYTLFYYYKQQRWRPIPLNKNQTYDEHITRTHCRKGTRVVLSLTTQRRTCTSPSVTPAQLATPTTEQSASLTDWQFTTTSDKVTPTPSSTASHCLHGTDRRQTSLLRSSGADATGDVSTNEAPRKRASSC